MLPALCCLGLPAQAGDSGDYADLGLEALMRVEVSAASRYAQPTREAPASVTVITREEIRDHAWRTLADLLDSVPGQFAASDGFYSYLGMRGLLRPADYNTRVALLIDGVPANDALYNQASLDRSFPLDLDLIERVEFVSGPGSAMYGSNAMLGVINVVTRNGHDLEGGRLSPGIGDNGERGLAARYGEGDDRQDFLAAASYVHDDGPSFAYPGSADYPAQRIAGRWGMRNQRAFLKYARGDLNFSATYSERHQAYPTAAYGTIPGDGGAWVEDRYLSLKLGHTAQLEPGLQLASSLAYSVQEYLGSYPYEDAGARILNQDKGRSRRWNLGLQATDLRIDDHTLVYGLDLQQEPELLQLNYDTAPVRRSLLNARNNASHAGVYAEDAWRLGAWILNTGLRADHYSSFGTAFSPRLALIQQFSPRTTFKYLLGSAYRTPNAYETYYADGLTQKPNLGLEPERSLSAEWAVMHRAPGGWEWEGSLFAQRIGRLIALEEDPADGLIQYRNTGTVKVRGSIFSLSREWADGTRGRASWSWTYASDRDGSAAFVPRALLKLDLTHPVGAWHATLEGRYLGRRAARDGASAPGTAWFNLALVSQGPVLAGANVSLRVDDLGDRRIVDPTSDEFDYSLLARQGMRAHLDLSWAW